MIIALAGRRVDADGAEERRFPPENTDAVRRKLDRLLTAGSVRALVSSAACGVDLLALDVARSSNIPAHPVLPFAKEKFRETSVTDRPGDWGPLFDAAIAEAETAGRLEVLGLDPASEDAYEAANLAILARAAALAGETGDHVTAVVVWEGKPRAGRDLTDAFRREAVRKNLPVIEILTL